MGGWGRRIASSRPAYLGYTVRMSQKKKKKER
jgi:hypothetical protein